MISRVPFVYSCVNLYEFLESGLHSLRTVDFHENVSAPAINSRYITIQHHTPIHLTHTRLLYTKSVTANQSFIASFCATYSHEFL
jgi:hypothetical protein